MGYTSRKSKNVDVESGGCSTTNCASWVSLSVAIFCTCVLTLLVQGAFLRPMVANPSDVAGSPGMRSVVARGGASYNSWSDGSDACNDWVAKPREETAKDNAWKQVKWIPRVAACPVAGLPIEELEPDFNFRRGYALGFTDFVEDKTHLLPFLRANVDPKMHASRRRVLVDLGGNYFNTSVDWFSRMYPLDFTEIHAFESVPGRFVIPEAASEQQETAQHFPAMNEWSRLRRKRIGPAPLPNWVLERIHLHQVLVGLEDTKDSVNITRWMLEDLGLTPDDTVIVKMDIESWEWKVLPFWMEVGMQNIVDELFVEVHYHHPSMGGYAWNPKNFAPSRDEAAQFLNRLRAAGFFVHAWP